MARFDIYRNAGKNQRNIPYLIELQSNVIGGLSTRVVAPLRATSVFSLQTIPTDLFPLIEVEGSDYFLDIPQLGAIPSAELKVKIGSAQAHQFDIQSALDRLFGAY